MKKRTILLLMSLCIIGMLQAQVNKTVNVATAGTLSTLLTVTERNTVTNLTITGTIDARDFKTMRNSMPVLSDIDISGASIAYYKGINGTYTSTTTSIEFFANTIPSYSFLDPETSISKTTLKSFVYSSSVTTIGASAFSRCTGLTSFSILPTITKIENSAFWGCSGLTSIIIPSSISTIYESTFNSCSNLSSVTIPSSVTSILHSAFMNCISLSSITLPSSISVINESTFAYSGLTSLTIPSSVTTIKRFAFQYCPNLITVTIPTSVTSIEERAFESCSKLSYITIPSSVSVIPEYCFENCSELTTISIPAGITLIDNNSFENCISLTSISIPASVTTIEILSFDNCGAFFTVDPNNLNYSSIDGVLFNKQQTELVKCPISKTGNYIIPSTVTTIKESAFLDSKLTSITIPSTVTSIEFYSFGECLDLKSIYVRSATPINLTEATIFYDVDKTNCILYVPIGSKNLYSNSNYWKDFINIIEVPELGISQSTIEFPKTEGNTIIDVSSYTTWSATTNQSWITLNPNSESFGVGSLTITASPNTGAARTATVTLTTGATTKTITITQAAGTVTEVEQIAAVNCNIAVVNGKLEITNPENLPVTIFDMQGKQVTMNDVVKGVYVVTVGSYSQKVCL